MDKINLEFTETYEDYLGQSCTINTNWGNAFSEAGLDPTAIDFIYAADEGENDGASWICAGKLKEGDYFFLTAWCDYTGWDCQAGGELFTNKSKKELERMNMSDEERTRLGIVLPEIEGVKPIVSYED